MAVLQATTYFAGREKLDMVHVPFKGGQPALTAVMWKSVDMLFSNSSDLIEPAKAGMVRALAVSTPKRYRNCRMSRICPAISRRQ